MLITGPSKGEWSPYILINFLMALGGVLKMVLFVLRAAEVMACFGWLVVSNKIDV